jgi:DNA invertase Pin-like site-specific DNA recombinase
MKRQARSSKRSKRQAGEPAPSNAAVAYCRVSTQEQVRGGVSLDAQTERLEAYCRVAGLDLVELIREEGVSGVKPIDTRPGGSQLLSMVTFGRVKHVVALKLDRLFRDAQDALFQTRNWDHAGIALHLVDVGGQSVNTNSPMGRMMLTVMAGLAELERNLIAERTAVALGHKKAHLQVYGPVPYGFERKGDLLVAVKAEQAVIEQMRVWRDGGTSLRQIAALLNEKGVATKAGGRRWYASTVQKVLNNDLHILGAVRNAA